MEIATIREAVAVFDEPASLEAAMSDLQSNGVDRADLSILAPPSPANSERGDMSGRNRNRAMLRKAAVSDTDIRQGRVLATSLAATIAGFAAAGVTVATGGVAAAVIGAAAVAAGGAGIAATLIGRRLDEEHASFLDAQLARGGVLLWVRTRDPEAEKTVLEVLRRYSTRVSIHDHPVGATVAVGASSRRRLKSFVDEQMAGKNHVS
jgi:hypothetical protein